MSAQEVVLGYQFLYATLAGDAQLQLVAPGGVHRAMAPPEALTPFVILSYQAGSDTDTMNGVRLLVEVAYQVKAVGPVDLTDALAAAAAEIDTALGGVEGLRNIAATGGYIHSCMRDSPLAVDELVNGEQWTNFGGLYRLQIQTI
jgi:hypothetical protein